MLDPHQEPLGLVLRTERAELGPELGVGVEWAERGTEARRDAQNRGQESR